MSVRSSPPPASRAFPATSKWVFGGREMFHLADAPRLPSISLHHSTGGGPIATFADTIFSTRPVAGGGFAGTPDDAPAARSTALFRRPPLRS